VAVERHRLVEDELRGVINTVIETTTARRRRLVLAPPK
jgi:hypothetical protein